MEKKVIATLREGLRQNVGEKGISRYANDVKQYSEYAKARYQETAGAVDLRRATPEQIKASTQDFIAFRREQGCSESTIAHNLTGIAQALGTTKSELPCETIYRGQPVKGRDDARWLVTPQNQRVVEFAKAVGIRRDEYAHLKGNNLVEREGRLYVVVEKGKGGKYQEQLIDRKDETLVKSYFNGDKNSYVFSKEEMKACEHANLHGYRREHAQEMYAKYEKQLRDPVEREKMKDLLESRWNQNPEKAGKFDRDLMEKPYIARGHVREELFNAGRPVEYDRLSLLAVSNLHLAHYREDVCVKNYMK